MPSLASFSGWLRGFLEGAGDRDLTQKQAKKIITEAQKALGKDEPEETAENDGPVLQPINPKKSKKPKTREELIAFAKSTTHVVPGVDGDVRVNGLDLPEVEMGDVG